MDGPVVLASDERGTGDVLLFVHGFPLDRDMWRAQLDGLATIRRCVAVDLRGHGDSAGPLVSSVDEHADDLAATLDSLGASEADVCGWSMGGYVALAFLRRHRARVRSLILCATKLQADSPADGTARDSAVERVRERGSTILVGELLPVMAARPSSALDETFASAVARLAPETAIADLVAMRDRADATALATGVRMLWLAGERDRIVPPGDARLAAARAGARFATIADAGHLVPLERADAFNDAVRVFLEGRRRGGWFRRRTR